MNGTLTTTTTALQLGCTEQAQTGTRTSLGAEFHYDPADPFAVSLDLESIFGPVRWTFGRDLLLDGRFEPTGDGDVHVWPCLDLHGAAVVIVELHSPAGATMLQLPARAVNEFAAASLAAVPAGAETADIDAWIHQLLGEVTGHGGVTA